MLADPNILEDSKMFYTWLKHHNKEYIAILKILRKARDLLIKGKWKKNMQKVVSMLERNGIVYSISPYILGGAKVGVVYFKKYGPSFFVIFRIAHPVKTLIVDVPKTTATRRIRDIKIGEVL